MRSVLENMIVNEYIETSAALNTNIPELYQKISKLAYEDSLVMRISAQPKTHFKLVKEEGTKHQKKKKKRC